MSGKYEVWGREWSSDDCQMRSTHGSLREAKRAARAWLSGRYLGESEAWVVRQNGVHVYWIRLSERGTVQHLVPYACGAVA